MGKVGFIGFGNMGGTMLTALLRAGSIPQDKTVVFTRTQQKLEDFVARYPRVEVARNISGLGSKCETVFICTGTKEVKPVLTELTPTLPANAHVISIAGTIEIKCLESLFKGKVTKLMPSMISGVGEGVTLACHNDKVRTQDKEFIRIAFEKIGKVLEIKEDQFDLAADLTSCAPAFFAAILRNLANASRKHGDFTTNEIKELILPTCYGTAKLLMENRIEFDDLISRVATKGGISEEGIKILDRRLPEIFDELLTTTLDKRQRTKKLMRQQFGID